MDGRNCIMDGYTYVPASWMVGRLHLKNLQVDDKTIVMVVDPGDDDRKSGGGERSVS